VVLKVRLPQVAALIAVFEHEESREEAGGQQDPLPAINSRMSEQLPDRAAWLTFRRIEEDPLMSRLMISALVLGAVTAAGVPAAPVSAVAAELLPPAVARVRHQHTAAWYGPCGCLHVSYVFHRELRSTYGLSFDPRNFDQTQPYYHFGPLRAYPRYWVDADPVQ
jgi:hypothetical protein